MPDDAPAPSAPPAPSRRKPSAKATGKAVGAASVPGAKTGVSALRQAMLKLGLARDIDLALHLPYRYEDETRLTPLAQAFEGSTVHTEVTVVSSEIGYRPRRQLVATVEDGDLRCVLRFFNFYPSHQKLLAPGARVRIRGELHGGFGGMSMVHPTVKPAGQPLPDALTPVYATVAGLPQAYLRKAVDVGLSRADLSPTLEDASLVAGLPESVQSWGLKRALDFLHHPAPGVSLAALEDRSHPAWQRLKAEELLAQQLAQHDARQARAEQRAPSLRARRDGLADQLLAALPFQLTLAQRRVVDEISQDIARTAPMHRLLQGDVGSGKTVVAALAAAVTMDAGWQCVLMAPTEILAQQHFAKLVDWLEPLLEPRGLCVAWLTGSQKKKERQAMLTVIADGRAALVVGTHAVIQEQVQFKALAFAVIDEQHRFGVAQRLALRAKMGDMGRPGDQAPTSPHLLMMSATPIPRTLAMSYYADLDVSTIDELPPGRTPVITRLVSDQRREEVVERIRAQVAEGRQVYWVCPLIEESEALDLTNATQTHAALSEAMPGTLVGLLHSRMPVSEKKAVMSLFTSGHIAVLVSTTVIEVGVDVPNASLMVIEHAERFGLSQLHQLRGRVGRGAAASACVLLYGTGESGRLSETARQRLRAMVETTDGFEIARRDLDIRGPGEFMGERQSGAALLRFADLNEDVGLLEWARGAAAWMMARKPLLAQRHVQRWLGGKSEFLKV